LEGPLAHDQDAHHIVPVRLGDEEMEALRDALHDAGIPINDARNGIALPSRSATSANPEARPIHQDVLHRSNQAYLVALWSEFADLFDDDLQLVAYQDQLEERLASVKQRIADERFMPPPQDD
jgi:hypothetical protein